MFTVLATGKTGMHKAIEKELAASILKLTIIHVQRDMDDWEATAIQFKPVDEREVGDPAVFISKFFDENVILNYEIKFQSL